MCCVGFGVNWWLGFMKYKLIAFKIVLLFISTLTYAQELSFITYSNIPIYFEIPDTSKWTCVQNELVNKYNKYVLMFKSNPIQDSSGYKIQPVISFIVETVQDSTNIISYSIQKRMQINFKVLKVLKVEDGYFDFPNSIGYEGEYSNEEIKHKVFIVHMIYNNIGVQIICDSTESVINVVEMEMKKFIKSVGINQ